ncbi:winged helix-turn-helix transcriptional regulator [Allokutzneria oryzae]|uniref:Winged helix-turn-helix transcriptional regulator n=1 Tax=Allokutzneria oryzae TaxID=1378989 RepID=A0ABV5ZYV4_9PSEU
METTCEQRGVLHSVYLRGCPSRDLLELIANKWTALLVGALEEGPKRFGELRRRVEGISQKVLTQNLRTLERDGMITRTVFPTTPPSVEYALTPLGRTVTMHLAAIRGWAEQHTAEIYSARAAFDARAAQSPEPVS